MLDSVGIIDDVTEIAALKADVFIASARAAYRCSDHNMSGGSYRNIGFDFSYEKQTITISATNSHRLFSRELPASVRSGGEYSLAISWDELRRAIRAVQEERCPIIYFSIRDCELAILSDDRHIITISIYGSGYSANPENCKMDGVGFVKWRQIFDRHTKRWSVTVSMKWLRLALENEARGDLIKFKMVDDELVVRTKSDDASSEKRLPARIRKYGKARKRDEYAFSREYFDEVINQLPKQSAFITFSLDAPDHGAVFETTCVPGWRHALMPCTDEESK